MTPEQRKVVESIADDYATRYAAVPAKIGGMIVDGNQYTAEALRACLAAADRATLSEEECELMSKMRDAVIWGDEVIAQGKSSLLGDFESFIRSRTGGAK
jgi:hypothetical protein